MHKVRSATFNGKKYKVSWTGWIGGVTDVDGPGEREILLIEGDEFKHFSSALHEALHAAGIPDKYLHQRDGDSKTDDIAKFLWRIWRITKRK